MKFLFVLFLLFSFSTAYAQKEIKTVYNFAYCDSYNNKNMNFYTTFTLEQVGKDFVVFIDINEVEYFLPIAKRVEKNNQILLHSAIDESYFVINFTYNKEVESIVWQDTLGTIKFKFYNVLVKI
jgi:hypothetical protein